MVLLFFCFCRGQWKHEARGWFLVEHGDRTNRFRMDGFEKLRKHQEAVMLFYQRYLGGNLGYLNLL